MLVDLNPNLHGFEDQVSPSRVPMESMGLGKVIATQVTRSTEEGNAVGFKIILSNESTHLVQTTIGPQNHSTVVVKNIVRMVSKSECQ